MKYLAGIFKIKKNIGYKNILEKAIFWIEKYSIKDGGIAVTSTQSSVIYPEVTGYYIPTLLLWGIRDQAIQFADWLVSIQNPDGSWSDPAGKSSYTFDTGQILKGLISLIEERPEYKNNIIKGCDWILSQQREDGSIETPDYSAWGLPGGKIIPESIHLYALEPLKIAAEKWNISKYKKCVEKALEFYLEQSSLTDFSTLSHFHAYIIEALIDLGQIERAREAMENVAKYQHKNGSVPAYADVKFVCSTGLFQYAICWYKLNDLERGNKAFVYAIGLQNKTGGWYGSYGRKANYFPKEEISWAVKYFLDALYWKMRCEFDTMAHIFPTQIDENDGRYVFIENELRKNNYKKVLDIGCGKGRFISKLKERNVDIEIYGVDISEEILKSVVSEVETKCGSLLKIPYPDNTFDLSFCIEALEHAVFIEGAIQEMVRVTKPGGSLVIIDKNIKKLGCMKLPEWECWFDARGLAEIMSKKGLTVSIQENIPYDEDNRADDLFIGWIGKKLNLK